MLKDRFQNAYLHEISEEMGFAISTISEHARQLGLYKHHPRQRNNDVRAFVEMEFDNMTYDEMAKRTGVSKYTIVKIARELGLKRTKEQWIANLSRKHKEMVASERRRVIYGLDQRTNLKVVHNPTKTNLRVKLRAFGYIIARGSHTAYYTDKTVRRPVKEANGMSMGFKFKPLPV